MTPEDVHFLGEIKKQMGIVADLSRADTLLYSPLVNGKTTVLQHAHPHSIAPVYLKNYTGVEVTLAEMPVIIKALSSSSKRRGPQGTFGDGARVAIEAWPVYFPVHSKRLIGVISIDTSLIEQERLRRRSPVFRRALHQLQVMLTKGLVVDADKVSPFGEQEGILVVDTAGHIGYASGIATNFYRKIGYIDGLVDHQLESLETNDDKLARKAMTTLACVEKESSDSGRDYVRTAIPLLSKPGLRASIGQWLKRSKLPEELVGVIIVLRDITEERRQEQELRVKNAMIQEIHHRVKNNLQTIAALLRIQTRRVKGNKPAEAALKDATSRILSIAVIHEFLSQNDEWAINVKEVSQRIITQLQQGLLNPEVSIKFHLDGPSIWLPSRQATACALVINELLQNSVEHGFGDQKEGNICTALHDEGDHVIITITDDGIGLPEGFDPTTVSSLGLQISRTLVMEDLKGTLDLLTGQDSGTTAKIIFPKAIFGGEEGWTENEYL